ncbi:MAG: prolipoprotein diacylglyceryl transferase [Bdellovibrionaceae bacterium]|nr:prolipoprotein diacylglyceryl transferase [Pseudobdellovibrionaceae bacterium]
MENFNAYVHHINPFALQFTETMGIRWYGLAYLAGIILGYFIIMKMIKLGRMEIKAEVLADFATWMAFGIFIGGRLGYCLFYAPHLFLEFHSGFPFWGVLEVHKGGMASHGGIIGVSVACFLFARKHKLNVLHCLDITVLGGSLGFFFGRIANFINGELYGRPVESAVKWAVKFPQELKEWTYYSPQSLLSLGDLVTKLSPLKIRGENGEQTMLATPEQWTEWVNNYRINLHANWSVNQFVDHVQMEAMKGNAQVLEALQHILTARHPSQLYQAILEGLLVFVILNLIWWVPRKPGVIAASFGFLYAFARIAGEQFRMPDSNIGFQLLGLTRGQWLSVAMVAAAALLMWFSLTRKNQPLGGWTKRN